mmetsp:Transcript_14017/g.52385  ORF Transcript_14017/g.52385 Transcript_14017/m.52385 type:complete len:279 (-) Transcript_14017:1231-2067(-)
MLSKSGGEYRGAPALMAPSTKAFRKARDSSTWMSSLLASTGTTWTYTSGFLISDSICKQRSCRLTSSDMVPASTNSSTPPSHSPVVAVSFMIELTSMHTVCRRFGWARNVSAYLASSCMTSAPVRLSAQEPYSPKVQAMAWITMSGRIVPSSLLSSRTTRKDSTARTHRSSLSSVLASARIDSRSCMTLSWTRSPQMMKMSVMVLMYHSSLGASFSATPMASWQSSFFRNWSPSTRRASMSVSMMPSTFCAFAIRHRRLSACVRSVGSVSSRQSMTAT